MNFGSMNEFVLSTLLALEDHESNFSPHSLHYQYLVLVLVVIPTSTKCLRVLQQTTDAHTKSIFLSYICYCMYLYSCCTSTCSNFHNNPFCFVFFALFFLESWWSIEKSEGLYTLTRLKVANRRTFFERLPTWRTWSDSSEPTSPRLKIMKRILGSPLRHT